MQAKKVTENEKEILVLDTSSGKMMTEDERKVAVEKEKAATPTIESITKTVLEKIKAETLLGQKDGIYVGKIFVIEGKLFKVKKILPKEIVLRHIKDEKDVQIKGKKQ